MRIFLTGAAGFVGAGIAAALSARGHSIICPVRGNTRLEPSQKQLTVVSADLADAGILRDLLGYFKPDAVCHAAWQGVSGAVRNDLVQEANVAVAASLAQIAAAAGVRTIVGLGSQAEYGPLNRLACEKDARNPTTRYGIAKCQAHDEMAAICGAQDIRFAWMRIFSLYGPGDNPGWLIPTVINALLKGECPALTACEQRWDFLHFADAARAIADVLEAPSARGIFNLGSGDAPRLRSTLEMLRDQVNPALSLGFGQIPYRPDQVMHLQADIGRLVTVTGWRPEITLCDGLAETVSWHRTRLGT